MLTAVAPFTDVFAHTPTPHPDNRGMFKQLFTTTSFAQATGYPFSLEQVNYSTSKKGVLRGLHYTAAHHPQAKYVTCVAGKFLDVVVDVRRGSDTFGQHATIELGAEDTTSLYIPPGYAHGFLALTDATVLYLTTAEYQPDAEFGINPLDPALGISWPEVGEKTLSDKDTHAPNLNEAELPHIDDVEAVLTEWKDFWAMANEAAGH